MRCRQREHRADPQDGCCTFVGILGFRMWLCNKSSASSMAFVSCSSNCKPVLQKDRVSAAAMDDHSRPFAPWEEGLQHALYLPINGAGRPAARGSPPSAWAAYRRKTGGATAERRTWAWKGAQMGNEARFVLMTSQ